MVCTGGEPLLQLDTDLIDALHARKFEIAVETNGTIEAPAGLDWICVSPKAGAEFKQRSGDELKLIFPQPGAEPEQFEKLPFRHFFLQPMDGPSRELNTKLALRVLPGSSALAAEPANAKAAGHSVRLGARDKRVQRAVQLTTVY